MKMRSLAIPFLALSLAGIATPALAATKPAGVASSVKSAVAQAATPVVSKPAAVAAPVVTPKAAAAPAVKASTRSKGMVNVNTGTKSALVALPGVGPSMAKTIIAGRPYKSLAQFEKALTPKWSTAAIKAVEAHISL